MLLKQKLFFYKVKNILEQRENIGTSIISFFHNVFFFFFCFLEILKVITKQQILDWSKLKDD